ncbi:MAG: hypothetical protein MUC40_06405 [Akkermansiaceae bacterium]|jgi:hypothetical protein|nr:hypothetical protein [Akkermansiaceae bacterium]
MKTGIITAAIAALTLLGSATQGEARPKRGHKGDQAYVSGYRSCGTPVYAQRHISHYKRCGTPVWKSRYVSPPRRYDYRVPVCPPPVRYCPPPVRYCPPPVQVCPPAYYQDYPRGGVVIQGTFRL